MRFLGYEQVTSIGTAKAVTGVAGATMMRIQATGQAVRLRQDGTAPTTTIGMSLIAGTTYEIPVSAAAANIKVIEEAATGVVNIEWYGED